MGPAQNNEIASKEYKELANKFEILEMDCRHRHGHLLDRVISLEHTLARDVDGILDQLKYNLMDCQYIDYKRLATDANYEKILDNLFWRAKEKLLAKAAELEEK